MLDETYFDPDAIIGVPRRFNHVGCSDGKDNCLIVTRTETGWTWFCHRCQKTGFRGIRSLSPSQTIAFIRGKSRGSDAPERRKDGASDGCRLPKDFSRNIPAIGLAWLYKYGITDHEIVKNNIGYSRYLNRVILPVYGNTGELLYWQGRNIGHITPTNPKYINQEASGRDGIFFEINNRLANKIALVEDIISAIKVGRCVSTRGLLYATVTDGLVRDLCTKYDEVIIWLDPDKKLYVVRKMQRYRTLGYKVKSIYTLKDPKYYSDDEIKTLIGD